MFEAKDAGLRFTSQGLHSAKRFTIEDTRGLYIGGAALSGGAGTLLLAGNLDPTKATVVRAPFTVGGSAQPGYENFGPVQDVHPAIGQDHTQTGSPVLFSLQSSASVAVVSVQLLLAPNSPAARNCHFTIREITFETGPLVYDSKLAGGGTTFNLPATGPDPTWFDLPIATLIPSRGQYQPLRCSLFSEKLDPISLLGQMIDFGGGPTFVPAIKLQQHAMSWKTLDGGGAIFDNLTDRSIPVIVVDDTDPDNIVRTALDSGLTVDGGINSKFHLHVNGYKGLELGANTFATQEVGEVVIQSNLTDSKKSTLVQVPYDDVSGSGIPIHTRLGEVHTQLRGSKATQVTSGSFKFRLKFEPQALAISHMSLLFPANQPQVNCRFVVGDYPYPDQEGTGVVYDSYPANKSRTFRLGGNDEEALEPLRLDTILGSTPGAYLYFNLICDAPITIYGTSVAEEDDTNCEPYLDMLAQNLDVVPMPAVQDAIFVSGAGLDIEEGATPGSVVLTNSGVVGLKAGNNVAITPDPVASGVFKIDATGGASPPNPILTLMPRGGSLSIPVAGSATMAWSDTSGLAGVGLACDSTSGYQLKNISTDVLYLLVTVGLSLSFNGTPGQRVSLQGTTVGTVNTPIAASIYMTDSTFTMERATSLVQMLPGNVLDLAMFNRTDAVVYANAVQNGQTFLSVALLSRGPA